ncbi:MAG: signal peptidase II [Endomicrobium sp.]|jgi:signal peptidase II|nr:signal peptidase II [Endomicrobium sp.]
MKSPQLFGIFFLILDQFAKFIVDHFVNYGSLVSVISTFNFFNITNIRNTGAAFGIFQRRNSLFFIGIFIILLCLSIWLYRNWNKINKVQQYAFCLIISGGTGNLFDRLFRGAVVDFLDLGFNSLRWPSFNIADSCICIAIFIILNSLIFDNKKKV